MLKVLLPGMMILSSLKHKQTGVKDGREGSAPSSPSPSAPAGLSRRLGQVIYYAALSLVVLAAIPYGTVEAWSIALFEIAVFVLAALWMAEGALGGGRWLRREHAVLIAPLALVSLYAYLQSLLPAGVTPTNLSEAISADPYETRLFALQFFAFTVFGALLLRYTTNRRRLLTFVLTILAVGILSALFGIVRQTMQRTGDQGFLLPHLSGGVGYAQFIGRNSFAFLMEMSLGLGLGLLIGVARERLMLVAAALLPLWAALVLCNSRGGIVSMIAEVVFAALVYLMLRPSRHRGARAAGDGEVETLGWRRLFGSALFKGALVLALFVITLTGTLWMGGAPLADRLETVSGELNPEARDPTGASRRDIWRSTVNLIKARPLAGSGFGAYWIAISRYHEGSGALSPQQAHNDYLELAAGGGLFGALLFLWFVYLFVRRVRFQLRSTDRFRRGACYGALVGLFGVSVHSLVDFGLHVTVNALVCLALIVIATANVGDAPADSAAASVRRPRG
jgi:O-antigen ligase